jgi:hypothetical protein
MSTPLRERPDAPLGTLIFRAGLLPAETIENALEEGVKTGRRLGEILIERGLIKEEDLTRLLAGQKGLPFVSLRERGVDPEAARLLAEDQARLFSALPIGHEDGVTVVALADPTNDILNRNVREALGQEARFVVAARSELNEVIGEVFSGALEAPAAPAHELSVPAPEPEPVAEATEQEPVVEPVEPEPVVEAEPVVAVAPEPEPVVEAAPEPAPAAEAHFDAAAYEPDPMPAPAAFQPEPAPAPEPVVEAVPEHEPLAPPYAASEPETSEPALDPEPEPEAEPEPIVADEAEATPLVRAPSAEPVADEMLPHTNGRVPEDFEDDSPPPAAASGAGFRVSIRLTSGERVTVAECAEIGEAKGYAKALTRQLGASDQDDWPFVNGRFLKPDTIVSVDVEPS